MFPEMGDRACDFPPNYTTPNCPFHEEIIVWGSQYTQLLAMSFAITGKLGYHELLSLFLSISLCLLSPNMSARGSTVSGLPQQ